MPGSPAQLPRPQHAVPKRLFLATALPAGLLYCAKQVHEAWTAGCFLETANDACVAADFASILPAISGPVCAVTIRENQSVRAGKVLFPIDDGDWRIVLALAKNTAATHAR